MAIKSIIGELLWIISGSTDATLLEKDGIKIWSANGSRKFLDSRGLTNYEEGDLGPIYGFQWRHCTADYKTCQTSYLGSGIDQLKMAIKLLQTEPFSRQIIVNSWQVRDLSKMALPPCHVMFQFLVKHSLNDPNQHELICIVSQRSADVGLGLPFNIAFYGILTHMVAQVVKMKAKEVHFMLGNAHIYHSHLSKLFEQTKLSPFEAPKIKLNSTITDIDDFTHKDIEIINYQCGNRIELDMAL